MKDCLKSLGSDKKSTYSCDIHPFKLFLLQTRWSEMDFIKLHVPVKFDQRNIVIVSDTVVLWMLYKVFDSQFDRC